MLRTNEIDLAITSPTEVTVSPMANSGIADSTGTFIVLLIREAYSRQNHSVPLNLVADQELFVLAFRSEVGMIASHIFRPGKAKGVGIAKDLG